MEKINLKKIAIVIIISYVLIGIAFFFIAGEQLHKKNEKKDTVTATNVTGELLDGESIQQSFIAEGDRITACSIQMATYGRANTGTLKIEILAKDKTLYKEYVDISNLVDGEFYNLKLKAPIDTQKGQHLLIELEAIGGTPGNAITVWTGTTISTGRVNIEKISTNEKLSYKGEILSGSLCYTITNQSDLPFGEYYWQFMLFGLVLLCLALGYINIEYRRGKSNVAICFINSFIKYKFLMQQLISRDFKTKYKRSVLGIIWSFLNPLLMMAVQYIVFSTIFKSSIPNFAVYLLIGIVCFSFFNEAATYALMSIVGNANLLTKVYVPKYIYPISKVCSAEINLFFSLIPVFLVLLVTRTNITWSILLIPFGIICLSLFSLGIGLILSSAMVFFRDTQFLWGVVSLLWMYATPIFYPETIIPEKFMGLYKMNPLYHFIRFIRITLIDGVSPEPRAYVFCFFAAMIPLLIGLIIFKKTQDKFILNI